jgi:hypothetical protein
MQMFRPQSLTPTANSLWCDAIFTAKALEKGGIVRRATRDVDREIGRDAFVREVRRRGFHLVEVSGQYLVICNPGRMTVIC